MSITPIHFTDSEGTRLVRVPLGNSRQSAILNHSDFERIQAKGYTGGWYLNGAEGCSYVRVYAGDHRGEQTTVARLITNAPRGQGVRYMDGNRLNLRRSNLYFDATGSASGVTKMTTEQRRTIKNRLQRAYRARLTAATKAA